MAHFWQHYKVSAALALSTALQKSKCEQILKTVRRTRSMKFL
ncbi:hypothetical protein ATORI0001_0732 [Lancefieldella rimae ATCC 49626]|uniref:Uncharacterized protein n=1 Tax=Lancefieldella rimae (strain ATCC 49626 / DSM 7090 / CCUG 31168 / NBRC 15546 / VPI D140H-11A) TaxID=553184 RepID=B9CL19_LANR4|nr:hypothetical protein ATORI0001_0732 [Lancefieldella rimae ATCC 49626]